MNFQTNDQTGKVLITTQLTLRPGMTTARVTTPAEDVVIAAKTPGTTLKWDNTAQLLVRTPSPVVFPALTARQLRLWMVSAGLSPGLVDTQIAAIADPIAKENAQIQWDYATTYERSHPLVSQLGTAIGLTSAQIDAAFLAAAKL